MTPVADCLSNVAGWRNCLNFRDSHLLQISISEFRICLLCSALLLSFCALPLFGDIIYLKNGKQIECISAWEDGKQVKYKIANGVVGIPRSIVAKIVQTQTATPAAPPANNESAKAVKDLSGSSTNVSMTTVEKLEKSDTSNPAVKDRLATLYTNLGVSMAEKNDFPGALENFQKAYRYVKDEDTASNLALTYFLLKDDFNADFYFNELLKMNSRSVLALNYLGDLYWRKENLTEAESYWKRSLAVTPDPAIQEKLNRLQKEKAASTGYENTTSRHFLVKYDGGQADQRLVHELSDFMEEVYRQLSSEYEAYPADPFIVILYPRQQFFKALDVPQWSVGANDGKIKLPVKGLTALTDDLKEVLTHELAHSFLDYKTGKNCPAWLHEGLAQYSEGKRVGPEGNEALVQLISNQQLPPISMLTASFASQNAQVATVLYLQSLSFLEYLIDRFQFYQVNEVLESLGKGVTVSEAVRDTFLVPLSRLDEEWRNELTGRAEDQTASQ